MHWLASWPEGFDILTHQNHFVFIFDLLALVPDLTLAFTRKVIRWAVRLSIYSYVCVHVSGLDNNWADLLPRWWETLITRRLVNIPALPSTQHDDFLWPSCQEIGQLQQRHSPSQPPHVKLDNGLLIDAGNFIWIPSNSTDTPWGLCAIAHTSSAGHRGHKTTLAVLSSTFTWDTLPQEIDLFGESCI